jgi:type 1 glutamine amidotransferase
MRSALIAWGGWEGHEPEQGAHVVRDMLLSEGFDVRVEQGSDAFAATDLAEMSLIVPIFTRSDIAKAPLDNLLAAVQAGAGLGSYHGGMAASFRNEVAFHFMCGVQWVAHPGNIIDYHVDITDRNDPITAGLESFDYRSEQYYIHVDPMAQVLATTTFTGDHAPWIAGAVVPVVIKKQFGAGRVFYTSLGHIAAEFKHATMREILRRGLLWAAR